VERKEKKEKLLREVTVKIGLKQKKDEEGIVVKPLLDSGAIGLVISEEFARKHKFRRTKLERPIYVRNMNGKLNYVGPIVDTVDVVNRCDRRLKIGSYIGYAVARTPQPRDRLENGRGTDNEMSKRVWKEIENGKTDKAGMAEAERERRMEEKKREREERKF